MAMLPIFMIGLIVGIALSYVWYKYKEDVPSKVKVELQEKEIKRQKSDNEMLHNLIDKLYKKIDELENKK